MDESRRYFIAHMQKTAGTSLRDRFRHSFAEAQIYPNASDGRDKRLSVISVRHLLERWEVRGPDVRLVAGHFPLATTELLGGDFVTLTVLRHPVERTLSYLRHQQKINAADRGRPLEEIYADPFRFKGLIENHMVRTLSLTVDEMRAGDGVLSEVPYTQERLDMAKAALSSLDAVGFQRDFEAFCDRVTAQLGIDLGPSLHSNATEPADAPGGLADRIAEDSALDMALYEFAVAEYGR